MQTLDDILNGDEGDLPQEEIPQTTEEPEGVKQPDEETPEPEKAEEEATQPEEGSPPEPEQPKTVPLDVVLDERRKRQELEQELAKYKQKQDEKPAPDVFEDQEAYTKHITTQINQGILNERANISQFMAKRDYPDLDEKVEKFHELVRENPQLREQALHSISPYHEIYDIVSKHEELEKMKDIDSYRASLRAEIEAEVKAEEASKKQELEQKRQSIPPSLVSEPSKGAITKGTQFDGPTPLENILD